MLQEAMDLSNDPPPTPPSTTPRPATPSPATAGEAAIALEPFPGRDALEREWRGLEERADTRFFLSWHWIGAMLAETGVAPMVLAARAGGRAVALCLVHEAPQRRHGGLLRTRKLFLNQTGDAAADAVYIEHNGFLIDRAQPPDLERRMLLHLARFAGPPDWDELRLAAVPARFLDHAAASGLAVHLLQEGVTSEVDLAALRRAGTPYLDSLSANTRYQLRRARRRYEAEGPLAIDAARDVAEAHDFLDALAALHQRYWTGRGRPGAFANPFMRRFHRRVIAAALPAGAVELLRVRAGERPIGYLYNLLQGGWVGAYCSGFAYAEDGKAKPGYVSFALAIQRHLERGAATFDFLLGESQYKASLGRPGAALASLDLQRPRAALKIESCLRRARAWWRRS